MTVKTFSILATKILSILVVSSTLTIAFTNCNKVQVTDLSGANGGVGGLGGSSTDPNSPNNPNGQPPGTTVVQAACTNPNKQRMSFSYLFPKPNITCEWGKDGNLTERDKYFQARIEQKNALVLPPGSIICDIKFTFAQQQFLYDDHFLMTFNDAVIASSYNFSNKLNAQYGLLRYDWTKLVGMFWDDSQEGVFCAPGGTCSWPDTDTPGQIRMSYNAAVFQKIMGENLNRNMHELKFVSIGDNDNLDCEHSDVSFNMDVEFVQK